MSILLINNYFMEHRVIKYTINLSEHLCVDKELFYETSCNKIYNKFIGEFMRR